MGKGRAWWAALLAGEEMHQRITALNLACRAGLVVPIPSGKRDLSPPSRGNLRRFRLDEADSLLIHAQGEIDGCPHR
jgi:hypothetical protein